MPKVTIDGRDVQVDPGATILDAARALGIEIPTMCFLDGHRAATSCMVCVVRANGSPRLVPSCATRVQEGMVVESQSDDVIAARRTALELLLGDHVGDCIGPCRSACPAHMDVPAMIGHISAGRYREAIATVKSRIALPATLGRICPEICEKGCRRAAHDGPVSICLLKRFVADVDLASEHPYMPECRPSTGRRVAVVGAGPTGLSAAYYLLQSGHACTVIDDRPEPGGMVRYSVPEDRLPHHVIDAEIALIRDLGAEFRTGVCIEDSRSLDALTREFDAVLLAVGKIDDAFAARLGLPWAGHGLRVDKATMMTGRQGVFAAGSAVSPSQAAVRAVADGRSAAIAIDGYLTGTPVDAHERPYSVHIGRLHECEIPVLMAGASESGRVVPPGDGFTESEARSESSRCMHCECAAQDDCKLRDYGHRYHANPSRFKGDRETVSRDQSHPHVTYEPGKCISCGLCVQLAEDADEPTGLTFIGRGFHVRPGVPFEEPFSDALRVVAEECVRACPTGALVMRDEWA